MAQVNDKLLSDLSRKALKGDHASFRLLMKILNELDHPILDRMDLRAVGSGALSAIAQPLSTLIKDAPFARVQLQSLTWETREGKPHSVDGPAEVWFDDPYISYALNGLRHREDGPAVIDIGNESISYFLKGKPRTHEKGPFRIERHEGRSMLTYVMNERMVNVGKGLHNDGLSSWEDDATQTRKYTDEPGEHVIVTWDYIDIEGVGKSDPSPKDIQNLKEWTLVFEKALKDGATYLVNYLNTFR
jgi:hypothetical protein